MIPNERILFLSGIVAGAVNVMAGGGSTLTLPVLIFAGLDSGMANGTNRVAILLQNLSATGSFHHKKVRGISRAILYALVAIPGAITGALFSIQLNQEWFERILGVIMIGVVISLFQKRKPVSATKTEEEKPNPMFYLSLFAIGFYGGFIQVGIGFILMASLFHFLKTTLVRVNFYKVIIVLIYTIPALTIRIYNDMVDWGLGLSLAAGSMTGAWLAAHLTVKKGDEFIRYVLAIVIIGMAIKLFL